MLRIIIVSFIFLIKTKKVKPKNKENQQKNKEKLQKKHKASKIRVSLFL